MKTDSGFLAIWSDVFDEELVDYLHWLTREHTQERVGIEGFAGVRVFRARIPGVNRYFILYRLADASVLGSAGYLERLNAPTPWSSRIMPILKNFARGGGSVTASAGSGWAGTITPILLDAAAIGPAKAQLPALMQRDLVVAARLLEVDQAGTTIRTNEKALRADDRSFAALLMVEAMDAERLRAAIEAVFPNGPEIAIYDQVFALDKADLAP